MSQTDNPNVPTDQARPGARRASADLHDHVGALRATVSAMRQVLSPEIGRAVGLGHGEWLSYLSKCSIPERTAEVYMRIARGRETIEPQIRSAADLSIRSALKLLAPPSANSKPNTSETLIDDAAGAPASEPAIPPGEAAERSEGTSEAEQSDLEPETPPESSPAAQIIPPTAAVHGEGGMAVNSTPIAAAQAPEIAEQRPKLDALAWLAATDDERMNFVAECGGIEAFYEAATEPERVRFADDYFPVDPVPKRKRGEKPKPRTIPLADAIEEAFAEFAELGEEMSGWAENMPENLQATEKYEAVSTAAETLEGISAPEIADSLGKLEVTITPRRCRSRADRCGYAIYLLEQCDEALGAADGDEAAALMQELAGIRDEAEQIEFPGMYG
jgi:hypothetical protein